MGKLEDTLAELATRRAAFKEFVDSVDEDLARQREERLASEKAAIRSLILTAVAQDASLGQVKRAYGTKDHRTIADVVKGGMAEIDAIRKQGTAEVTDMPEWVHALTSHEAVVVVDGDSATYGWSAMGDGALLFSTEAPLWDETYTHKNEAVSLLDGKTENDSAEARVLAKFIRKTQRTN